MAWFQKVYNTAGTEETSASKRISISHRQNNENLPPDHVLGGGVTKKKYTVNKKRSAKECYDRLKKHVPALDGKNDVSQLDVLLEAIDYIHTLRKDLGKEQQNDKD